MKENMLVYSSCCCSVTESNSLWPHGLQHARPPCPSPSPRICSGSCALSLWCHTTISSANVEWSLKHLCSSVVGGCVCGLEIKHSVAMSSLTSLCSCGVLGADFSFVRHTLPFICYSKCREKKIMEASHQSVFLCVGVCSITESCLTPVARQAPLSMEFSRQEYWHELPCPPPGGSPHPGIKTTSPLSPALSAGFFTVVPLGKPCLLVWLILLFKEHKFIYFQISAMLWLHFSVTIYLLL